jgi:hypothetical protein
MESLDRPYGDDEADNVTVDPESHADTAEQDAPLPTIDGDDHATDPAFQAVEEAGGGVSEGFEAAEGQLIDNIEGAPPADLEADAFDPADPGTDVDEDVADDVARTLEDQDPGDAGAVPRADEEAAVRDASEKYGEPDTEQIEDAE